jgi:hypothetical protein
MKIGESKTRITESKMKSEKSFKVTTMSVLNAHGVQVNYLNVLCSVVVSTL